MQRSHSQPLTLGIFLPTWVGDSCLATPTLRAIRGGFPDAKLVGIMRPVVRDVLSDAWGAGQPWLDETILFQKKPTTDAYSRWGLCRPLRQQKLDIAVLLTNSLWSAAVVRLAGARRIVGYNRDARGWLLSDPLTVPRNGRQLRPISPIDYYLELAAWLGCETGNRQMQLGVSDEDQQRCDALWNQIDFSDALPTIAINCGSATTATRLWPLAKVHELAHRIADELGSQVMLHCGPAERDDCNQIAHKAEHPKIASMGVMPDLPIGLSKAVLKRCTATVSTDSGPRHLAVALQRPVITLYGPTDPAWTQTYNLPEIAITEELECRPCYKSPCPLKHHRCMQDISVQRVLEAVKQCVWGQTAAA